MGWEHEMDREPKGERVVLTGRWGCGYTNRIAS